MAGKLLDQGENRILNQLFEATSVDTTLELRLYCAPATEPPENAVFADITEPSGAGYGAITKHSRLPVRGVMCMVTLFVFQLPMR
jgi:hypothetical protein